MDSTLVNDILINTFCGTIIAAVFGVLVWSLPKLYDADFSWTALMRELTQEFKKPEHVIKVDGSALILETEELSELANSILDSITARGALFNLALSSETRWFVMSFGFNDFKDGNLLNYVEPEDAKIAYDAALTRHVSNYALLNGFTEIPQIDSHRSINDCFTRQNVAA